MPERFACISADPPWLERGGGKSKRGADKHYPLMNLRDIHRTIAFDSPFDTAPNCHLWLWVTNNFLRDGLALMDLLGFRYVTNLVWVKDRFGLGQYLRGQHELCLFGVRGRLPSASRSVPTVVQAPRGKHSAKPAEAYAAIEAVSPGPRLELFARQPREGWTVWGNEVP